MDKAAIMKSLAKAKKRLANTKPDYSRYQAIDEWRDWNTDDDGEPLRPVGMKWNDRLHRWEILSNRDFVCTLTTGGKGLSAHVFKLHKITNNDALYDLRGNLTTSPVARCMTPPAILRAPTSALKLYNHILTNDIL